MVGNYRENFANQYRSTWLPRRWGSGAAPLLPFYAHIFLFFFFFVCTQITYECVSLTFHPFGTALVAGSVEGYLIILNAENGSVVSSVRVCGSALTCMGFNPGNTIKYSYLCTVLRLPSRTRLHVTLFVRNAPVINARSIQSLKRRILREKLSQLFLS